MKKILDIGGMYTNSFGEYEEGNYLLGRILLDDDNRFEGVVESNCSNSSYLVFGHLNKDQLDFIVGNDEIKEVPKRLKTQKNNNVFDGTLYAKDIFNEIPMGECRVSIRPAEQTREVTDYELSIIKRQIELQKINLGFRTKELYADFIEKEKKETGLKK